MRIASLLPAATEMLCALDLAPQLVGRSHECDYPAAIEKLPVLTRSRLGPLPSSGAIDRELRSLVAQTLAVFEVDEQALQRVRPDAIVTQDLCEVCAVRRAAVEAALCSLAGPKIQLLALSPLRLGDLWTDLGRLGQAFGREEQAAALCQRLQSRLAQLEARVAGLPRRSVLSIEWLDPVMIGGTWMPELVEIAGGRALVTSAGERAPTLGREELAELRPEVVLVKSCGFTLERARRELELLRACLQGLPWPALHSGAVYLADGNAYFNRPGPRLVESAEILAACIHPRACADFAVRHRDAFERVA